MAGISAISFLAPWLLLGLLVLPVLWLLLRAVPPAPLRRRFPAVALLLGLEDKETTPDRTPWWLLLIRLLAVAAVIIGFAGPILNPVERVAGKGPLLIGMDASWASANDWAARVAKLDEILQEAAIDGRPVALVRWTDAPLVDAPLEFAAASTWAGRLAGMVPNAWEPSYDTWHAPLRAAADDVDEVIWVSDGLARDGQDEMRGVLQQTGDLSVVRPVGAVTALRPLQFSDGMLRTQVVRSDASVEQSASVEVYGPDPTGITRRLDQVVVDLPVGETVADVAFDLPTELRNRVTQAKIAGLRSAGAVTLSDDAIQRRKVALLGAEEQEGGSLLSGLHFLRKALVPTADVIETDLATSLLTSPDVLVFDDIGTLTAGETSDVVEWVSEGGTLLRFAGPKLTASGLGLIEEHPLLPVRLRAGGRSIGGAMSWGEPRALRDFPENSPFFGLEVPNDVNVTTQVVAQPDPNLADRVLASLADGTPLVTAKDLGQGRVILFHVSANAEWSTLPLSGLFVQMLERLAISARTAALSAEDLKDTVWTVERILDGFGELQSVSGIGGVAGEALALGGVGSDVPPGVYAHQDRRLAMNVIHADRDLQSASWPAGLPIISMERSPEQPLKAWLLMAAFGLLMFDILATLWLGGRLFMRPVGQVAAVALAGFVAGLPGEAMADDVAAKLAANNTILAYVKTGDLKLDETSHAGMLGLSTELFRRTSIEPIEPVGVDIELDDFSLYPFIYWPISEGQPRPTDMAVAKLNAFLRQGGMIMFDTRDANLSANVGGGTPNGRKLQEIAARLDIPRIEPISEDHVLTRAFYLLQDFPGRYANSAVWVEAAPPDASQTEGVPFRNLNDGVTPVVIGGNDWAAAWAILENGRYMYPVGRGTAGDRQREIATRFGVNLLMYVMTGNYKSDQVHVPALLDRLGQ